MGAQKIKLKLSRAGLPALVLLTGISFGVSWAGWLPARLIENWYALGVFPVMSRAAVALAAAVPFSWLDLLVPAALTGLAYMLYRRRFTAILGLAAAGYLFFFWTWGLNYHRLPLVSKLDFEAGRVTDDSIRALGEEAARQLNALYPEQRARVLDDAAVDQESGRRVAAVLRVIDGRDWPSDSPVKISRVLDPFFRAAGVEGMFNPFGHEALVTSGLLSFERPMVVLHEIAHVRGYPHEGDANFIALVGAIHSGEPLFRYSGWLGLWLYFRSPELDRLLDPGPRRDVEAVFARIRRQRVSWISRAQSQTLDVFLKAHQVDGGVRAYAEIVALAAGTRHSWERFRVVPDQR